MTSQIYQCRRAVMRACHSMMTAQKNAPKHNTGGAQIERRIVHIREKLSELTKLLEPDARDTDGHDHG